MPVHNVGRSASDNLEVPFGSKGGIPVRWAYFRFAPKSYEYALDRHPAECHEDSGGLPEPGAAVARRLHAEHTLLPQRIVVEADVFDHERLLLQLPFDRPGEMGFLQLLPQPGDLKHIRPWKQDCKTHGAITRSVRPLG